MNVGILGFAHGHVNAYCSVWQEQPELDIRVVAGWDADEGRLAEAAAKYGLRMESSVDALLVGDAVEAVVIAAETAYHAELVEKAAAAGIAIILQKPLALTLEEADRIVMAVERAGVPFTLAWQMRVDPHNLQVKTLLQNGDFGRIFMVRRRHCLTTQAMGNFADSWHVQPALNRDIFADDAAHPADFLYWLLGMPQSVTAELGSLLDPRIPRDNGIAVYRYADGTFGEISCSFVAVAGENVTEIVCERGTIIQNYGDAVTSGVPEPARGVQLKWYLASAGEWTISDLPEIRSQWQRICGLARPLAQYLHGDRPPIATVREGRDVLRMILACYASSDDGRRISLQ